MMKRLLWLLLIGYMPLLQAQYIPNGYNFGIGFQAGYGKQEQLGTTLLFEYAPTCYNTFLVEYTSFFSVLNNKEKPVQELAVGVHRILINFEPTYITVGLGYVVNNSNLFEERKDDALLFFQTGTINHGLYLKLRGVVRVSKPLHLYAAFNLKSLGRYYDTVGIGLLYDFELD